MNSGMDQKRLQRIRPLMERFIGEGNQLPGAQALVWRRGELVDFQSAGYRDRENRLPVEEDTIFRIYSMTKPIVSVAAMMLFEEGHSSFYPVSEFIPGFRNLQVFKEEDTGNRSMGHGKAQSSSHDSRTSDPHFRTDLWSSSRSSSSGASLQRNAT